jgi:hypothetical protein
MPELAALEFAPQSNIPERTFDPLSIFLGRSVTVAYY